jgi:hypothetical protein
MHPDPQFQPEALPRIWSEDVPSLPPV